jgi:deoxyinosine 3'endonuclease (endonuclease V)
MDISFIKGNKQDACACFVVLELPSFKARVSSPAISSLSSPAISSLFGRSQQIVYEECTMVTLHLPYLPSFLAFREAPSLLAMLARLRATRPELEPQVLLLDGNGVLHTRCCGVACHVGVLADIPTVCFL